MADSNGHNGIDPHGESHSDYMQRSSLATQSVHGGDHLIKTTDVAPPMHVSTIFHYPRDPNKLKPAESVEIDEQLIANPEMYYYSRLAGPNATRLEAALSTLLHGRVVVYASGLAAFHAMLVYLNPKRIVIGEGYHGCHDVIGIMKKLSGLKQLDLHDEKSWANGGIGPGDIVHVETPLNPTGEAYNLEHYAELAHKNGAYLTVDATFGPPGLQDPFKHGADFVMHSGTKYVGGHSDMLCGILAVQREEWWVGLWKEREFLGSVIGSLEGWLGIRSLRTLELRVQRQSKNAEALAAWLDGLLHSSSEDEDAKVVKKVMTGVHHASLQKNEMSWLKKQMPNGFGPVFAIIMRDMKAAKTLPSKLRLFHHATSLGGVESLIEWRSMSDPGADKRLLRISIGVEGWEDLRDDLLQGFEALAEEDV